MVPTQNYYSALCFYTLDVGDDFFVVSTRDITTSTSLLFLFEILTFFVVLTRIITPCFCSYTRYYAFFVVPIRDITPSLLFLHSYTKCYTLFFVPTRDILPSLLFILEILRLLCCFCIHSRLHSYTSYFAFFFPTRDVTAWCFSPTRAIHANLLRLVFFFVFAQDITSSLLFRSNRAHGFENAGLDKIQKAPEKKVSQGNSTFKLIIPGRKIRNPENSGYPVDIRRGDF